MVKVSVVMPIYKVENYIKKSIESVLCQSERDFELILVDDGSPDSCGEICDRYAEMDERVRVIHQENAGLGGARNTGISQASGEWIYFIDSDDTIAPETLKTALKEAEAHDADMVVFGFRSVLEDGGTAGDFVDVFKKMSPTSLAENSRLLYMWPCAWNKLYKRKLFTENKIEYPPRVWYEDIRTTLKLIVYAKKIVFIDDILYFYLQRQGSITQNSNTSRNREIIWAIEDIIDFYKSKGLYERYRNEIEYLAVLHIYVTAGVRLIKIDPRDKLISQMSDYIESRFPSYYKNPELMELDRNKRLILRLLRKKRYFLIRMIFKVKGILGVSS